MPDILIGDDEDLEPLRIRLSKDLKKAAESLTVGQVRYLVDTYYQIQRFRIAAAHEARTGAAAQEPVEFVQWVGGGLSSFERAIATAMDVYTSAHAHTRWLKACCGIGPVLSAGLTAHIDITKAPTVGHIWRFSGVDPTVTWDKNTKRPWNARLKVLQWKCGESFVKVQGREDDVYGKIYAARKVLEQTRNEAGQFADQAAAMLTKKKFTRDTVAKQHYLAGRLPPGHIHARAKRYAVKLFLSHLHEAFYVERYHALPPKPYVISHLHHAHEIVPPHIELIPGWGALRARSQTS